MPLIADDLSRDNELCGTVVTGEWLIRDRQYVSVLYLVCGTRAVVLSDYRGELAEDLRAGTGLLTNLLLTLTAFNQL